MLLVLFKRFLGKRIRHGSGGEGGETLEQLVLRAQHGDAKLRNQLITDYQPFIAKLTSRFSRKYIDPSRDDEFSVALDGFNEAIQKFSPESGRSFLGFAETVIRRRLIDYVRKEQKFQHAVPYSAFDVVDDEDQVVNPVEMQQALRQYEADRDSEARRLEIIELTGLLAKFGISFAELADASPKHVDSRQLLFGIARTLAQSDEMMELLLAKGQLPVKQLLSVVDVSRKTVERNRKYIIAVALIYHGQFPYLQDYICPDIETVERSGAHA